jgi:hypothetical protein
MVGLAELKMHIRDEYLRLNKRTEDRKRQFGRKEEKVGVDGDTAMVPAAPQQIQAADAGDDVGDAEAEIMREDWETLRNRYASMMDLQSAAEGETPTYDAAGRRTITLLNLFNYQTDSWCNIACRSGVKNLNDEQTFMEEMEAETAGQVAPDLHQPDEFFLNQN